MIEALFPEFYEQLREFSERSTAIIYILYFGIFTSLYIFFILRFLNKKRGHIHAFKIESGQLFSLILHGTSLGFGAIVVLAPTLAGEIFLRQPAIATIIGIQILLTSFFEIVRTSRGADRHLDKDKLK